MDFTRSIGYLSMILQCEVAEILLVNSGIHVMEYYLELDIEARVLHLADPNFSESSDLFRPQNN